jgi:DNA-binding MarR family transcriptional regulator
MGRMPAAKERSSRTPRVNAASHENHDLALQVLRQFRLVFNAVKTHFQQVEKRAGIGGAQLWALSIVQRAPDIGVVQLSRTMDIHQSTASNLVKLLVERGLVTAERNGDDRRSVQLRLLRAGSKVLRKAPGPFSGVLPQALEGLDVATLRRMKKDLRALLTALQPDKRAARTPLADL